MKEGVKVPNTTIAFRVGDEAPEPGLCPIGGEFVYKTTDELFGNKRVVVFSLPGAYTPTCSTYQLPGFEQNYQKFIDAGVDEIYVASVNDAFVMNCWLEKEGVVNVKPLPDGTGEFTRLMGMLVDKSNLGFGYRSWRYAAIISNGVVEKWFEEPGREDNHGEDPYGETTPENVYAFLQRGNKP